MAKASEQIGILEARRSNLDSALRHLAQAGRHYQAYGNQICAIGVTRTNISYACLVARRYQEAVAPAEEAIAFFTEMKLPYWLSLNEANLAEAFAHLGRLESAEALAWHALAGEEPSVRPYGLYVLGHIRREQGQYQEAERYCHDAIDSAKANSDPWAAVPAWRVLGETYRDWGRAADARAAFQAAIDTCARIGFTAEIEWLQERIGALERQT
jgi:tetratricopeptide (TPR) repeat protein